MKTYLAALMMLVTPLVTMAEEENVPSISSTCVVRSRPGGRDGSTVEYTWTITAKAAKEKRILSVAQMRRSVIENLGEEPWILGWEKALWLDPGSSRQEEITLEIDQAPDGGERSYWFEGFVVERNEDMALPETASITATTTEVDSDDDAGQLIDITVADEKGREISQHFIYLRYVKTEDYEEFAKEADVDPGKQWKTTVWQRFMDPNEVKQLFGRVKNLTK
ncbi:hypothetical protein [Bremerella volcania]|nr:hypothetical protein [Bremerella volcania]